MTDYYKTLGIEKNASQEEIKKAYKKMAKLYHPDLNKNHDAEKKFKEINEAFSILSDEKKRAQFDQFGKVGPDMAGGYSGGGGEGFEGFNFDGDPINDIFESFFGGTRRRRRSEAQRGSDLLFEIEISLEDAYKGTKKNISIPRHETCDNCNGSGAEKDNDMTQCPQCEGRGIFARQQRTPFGVFQTTTPCNNCNGTGKVIKNFCHKCHGNGKIKGKKEIEITIPRGIDEGNRLRVHGGGEAGEKGGSYGDLYVQIKIKEHPFFTREERDLHTSIPISFTQASLGDSIEVPTLSGTATLKIPPGTQSGTQFRMHEKGMPSFNSDDYGDEYIEIKIETPTKLTKKQKELLKEFEKESEDKPYSHFMKKFKQFFS